MLFETTSSGLSQLSKSSGPSFDQHKVFLVSLDEQQVEGDDQDSGDVKQEAGAVQEN